MAHRKETKALTKKNIAGKAPLAEAVMAASTTTVLPSNAEKAALTTTAATTATTKTTPAGDKAPNRFSNCYVTTFMFVYVT